MFNGRIFLISAPIVGSKLVNQISPRLGKRESHQIKAVETASTQTKPADAG